jgi:hypothetical protein
VWLTHLASTNLAMFSFFDSIFHTTQPHTQDAVTLVSPLVTQDMDFLVVLEQPGNKLFAVDDCQLLEALGENFSR